MEISITKKKLKILCIVGVIIVIISAIGISIYTEKRNEQRRLEAFVSSVDRAIEREYKSLKSQYDSYVEVIEDYSYSYSFRWDYVKKVNKLLGGYVYKIDNLAMDAIYNFLKTQPEREADDLKLLRQVATKNVLED